MSPKVGTIGIAAISDLERDRRLQNNADRRLDDYDMLGRHVLCPMSRHPQINLEQKDFKLEKLCKTRADVHCLLGRSTLEGTLSHW